MVAFEPVHGFRPHNNGQPGNAGARDSMCARQILITHDYVAKCFLPRNQTPSAASADVSTNTQHTVCRRVCGDQEVVANMDCKLRHGFELLPGQAAHERVEGEFVHELHHREIQVQELVADRKAWCQLLGITHAVEHAEKMRGFGLQRSPFYTNSDAGGALYRQLLPWIAD
ncbi:hypothetical protein B0H17DRAFT_1142196 [Mycena rosella]|uniref:Uncharacterized protein n=1 Tax=Mycena rosella TaxID=1033263 RepID=A0AAD7CXT5_MYCRO|nr:hypothetical protein B0H17DRAFT_1142196 [Mycena rosella]